MGENRKLLLWTLQVQERVSGELEGEEKNWRASGDKKGLRGKMLPWKGMLWSLEERSGGAKLWFRERARAKA